MRTIFLINPTTRRQRAEGLARAIRKEFTDPRIEIVSDASALARTLIVTEGKQSRTSSGNPEAMLVAVGGDGTLHRAIVASAALGVPVGILPCGRANDFARALGIPRDFQRACAVIRETHLVDVDLLSINGVFFATCGGIGLVEAVSSRADRWRVSRRPGSGLLRALGAVTYPLATLIEVGGGWRPIDACVHVGGEVRRATYAAIVVSNQPSFGGWFKASPDASNRDGRFHVCEIISPRRRSRMLRICVEILRSRGDLCAEVRLCRADSLTITTGRDVTFYADGEALQRGRRFDLRVHPSMLRVAVPRCLASPTTCPIEVGHAV